MPNTVTDQERDKVHKSIEDIADNLRGSVDGWDFKAYVLGTMFYRFISENLTEYLNKNEHASGSPAFNYADLTDDDAEAARDDMIKTKGFFILPSELFCNVLKNAKDDENLNVTLERVFANIINSTKGTQSETGFEGLFEDFKPNAPILGKTVIERNKKLVDLLEGIGGMQLGALQENSIDAFGDAYEYLMRMYAGNAGKSGGEYFTPQSVAELLAQIVVMGKTDIESIYDPACGSGSLLLQATKIIGKDGVRKGFFGQETNPTSYNLCRINMILHDIGYDKFNIAQGDTLLSPAHWDEAPFEAVVSNPPYSKKWPGNDDPVLINDMRYSPAGALAPKNYSDYAFIMHALSWLAPNGTAAIVCFPGIMYRGNAELKIRKYLIDNNFVDAVIQLPDNMFFGTSIATCIMVLKKNRQHSGVLFVDASGEYIKKDTKNVFTKENIDYILQILRDRKDIEYAARAASYDEIVAKNYNLSVSGYVETKDTREHIDISALNAEIKGIVAREQRLREEIDSLVGELI